MIWKGEKEAIKIKIPQAFKLRRTHFSFVVVYWLMGSGQQVEISSLKKNNNQKEKKKDDSRGSRSLVGLGLQPAAGL